MRRTVLAALMALLAFGGNALADNFPSHPITLVVPFSAGGPTDAMARILADHMRTTLGQNIVIENVTGAAGSLGVGRVVRAAPDGYTVSIGHLGTHVANGAIYKLGYDLVADLEPVVLLPSNPMIIVSNECGSGQNAEGADRVAEGEADPGHGRHRGRRFGKPHRRALFRKRHRHQAAICALSRHRAGADRSRRGPDRYHHRPDFQFDRPGARRAPSAPMPSPTTSASSSAADVPTADEAGLSGFHMTLWSGLWVPKNTPKDIVVKLNAAAVDAMSDPAVRKKFEDLGLQMPPKDSCRRRRSAPGRRRKSKNGGR